MTQCDAKASHSDGALIARVLHLSLLCLLVTVVAGCAPRTAKRLQGIHHVVRPGENLYRIGKAYGVSHEELARVNRMRDSAQIRAGQRIFIPGAMRQLPVEIIVPAEIAPGPPPVPETARETPSYPSLNQPLGQAFIWPISGTINSGFGSRGSSFHDGIDIAAPVGTPIRAVDGGEVIYSDQLRGYGNMVIVRHAEGFVSVYAHNERNLVREGQQVSRGETIARVGSTGRVTGPHLHFEIRRNNTAQDPLRYLPRLCCAAASGRLTPGG